jgi:hypothetical protein
MAARTIEAYHRTETLRPAGFVAKVEIVGIVNPLRDDDYIFRTKEDAQAREIELAEKWKRDNFPDAVVIFSN